MDKQYYPVEIEEKWSRIWSKRILSNKNSKTAATRTACLIVKTLLPTDVPMAFATSFAPTPQAVKKPNIADEISIKGIPKRDNSTKVIT